MPPLSKEEVDQLAKSACEFLSTPEGQLGFEEAIRLGREDAERIRRALTPDPEKLRNLRFDI